MRLGSAGALRQIEVIPSGALVIDLASVGRCPATHRRDHGPESSGKTTLMLHLIANAQKAGESRPSLMPSTRWIRLCKEARRGPRKPPGVPTGSGEGGAHHLRNARALGALDIIVVDSVAALRSEGRVEGEMGMATMGMQGAIDVPGCASSRLSRKAKTTCLFTNQLREKWA